jgi:DNA-binding Lrp family transcriptional regulator
MELDELDNRILGVLQENARLSYREIGKTLGISHANVSTRIKRLEENNVIKGYTVVLNPEFFEPYTLCLQISAKPGFDLFAITKIINDISQVSTVLRVSGEKDLLVLAMCKNRQDALDIISEISGISGIDKIESHVVLEIMKQNLYCVSKLPSNSRIPKTESLKE